MYAKLLNQCTEEPQNLFNHPHQFLRLSFLTEKNLLIRKHLLLPLWSLALHHPLDTFCLFYSQKDQICKGRIQQFESSHPVKSQIEMSFTISLRGKAWGRKLPSRIDKLDTWCKNLWPQTLRQWINRGLKDGFDCLQHETLGGGEGAKKRHKGV